MIWPLLGSLRAPASGMPRQRGLMREHRCTERPAYTLKCSLRCRCRCHPLRNRNVLTPERLSWICVARTNAPRHSSRHHTYGRLKCGPFLFDLFREHRPLYITFTGRTMVKLYVYTRIGRSPENDNGRALLWNWNPCPRTSPKSHFECARLLQKS